MNKKTTSVITVLAVLLALTLIALCGVLIYSKTVADIPATVTVPDNLITDKKGSDKQVDTVGGEAESNSTEKTTYTAAPNEERQAASIELYAGNDSENKAFAVSNMFPGDEVTKYFRVRVKYENQATVRFRVTVRNGGEKLAEVLKIRVVLLSTDETLYDGLIKDFPENIIHTISGGTEGELYYAVVGYLDTSVDNGYQEKNLVADFEWQVLEKENLQPEITGDVLNIGTFTLLICAAVLFFMLIVALRRRREDENE